MIEKAVDFIKGINGKTALIFDNDGDGIGAAAIIAKYLKTIFNRYPETVPKIDDPFFLREADFEKIRDFSFIITLDVPFDERPKYILKLAKKSKVLVIDHHQVHKNLNGHRNIVHVNPELCQTKFPSYKYCVSKIVYDILSRVNNIEGSDWLSAIGIVNDKCEDTWKDFLDNVYRKYSISAKDLRLVNDIVNSGYYHSGEKGVKVGYKACLEASSPVDIIMARTPSSKKLKRFYNSIEKEIASVMKSWKKKAEIFEDKKLIILRLDTKISINSPISSKISTEKPNYTVIVARKKGDMTSASFRRQDEKINCGKLANNLTKNLRNAKGGGHIPAAGATIMSKNWKIFREKILDLL